MKHQKIYESIQLFKNSIFVKSNLYNNFALGWLYIINKDYSKATDIFIKTKELFSSKQALAFIQMLKGNNREAMILFKKGLVIYKVCKSPHELEIPLIHENKTYQFNKIHNYKKSNISNINLLISKNYSEILNRAYSYLLDGRNDLAEKLFINLSNNIYKIL